MRLSTDQFRDRQPSRFPPGYVMLTIAITLVGIGVSITRPYLSLFATDVIHMSAAAFGIFMCVNALGGIIASTWLGKLSDSRVPKRDVIIISAICSALGYGCFLVFHNYVLLLISSTILLGLGASTFPQIFAYARENANRVPGTDATFAISMLRSFFSLAWVIGPLVGAWALSVYHFNGLFVFTALLFVAVLGIVMVRMERRASAGVHARSSASVIETLKRKDVLTSCISCVAVYTASSINGLYMPLFVTRTLHAPAHVVGWVASLSAGLEIPIMLILGSLADRIGKRKILLFGSLCGTLYFLGSSFADHVWEFLILQFVCAIFISISVSIGMSYIQDFMPEAPGSATTLYSNTNNIGAMAGSLLGGAIAQSFGYRADYLFCAILGIISFVFLLRRRQRRIPAVATEIPESRPS